MLSGQKARRGGDGVSEVHKYGSAQHGHHHVLSSDLNIGHTVTR